MAMLSDPHMWLFISGILGNIISFMVFLAPVPTFYAIVKNKSSQGYQSIPYLVALFSCTLWIFYALIKTNSLPLMTINSIGCALEITYIVIYIVYAPNKAKMMTLKIFFLFNFGGLALIAFCCYFLVKESNQVRLLGWIGLAFGVGVFAAPFGIMRQVIRTKSVEHMPFTLSFFLTLNAVAWFFYGLLKNDYFIFFPNTLGFAFGILQMILYIFYKYCNKLAPEDQKQPTIEEQSSSKVIEIPAVLSVADLSDNRVTKDQRFDEGQRVASNQV